MEVAGYPLASRLKRLVARSIDIMLRMLVFLPMMLIFIGPEKLQNFPNGLTPRDRMIIVLLHVVIFVVLHGFWLYRFGQTVGKRLLKIKMVDAQGQVPPLGKLLVMRYAIFWLVAEASILGIVIVILDVVMIFRPDHKCLHDHTAGTMVIDCLSAKSSR